MKFNSHNMGCSIRVWITGVTDAWVPLSFIPAMNRWYMFSLVYDGEKKFLKGYRDGKETYTGSWTGTVTERNANWGIGGPHPDGYPFNGLIDEVRIYNRALTAAQIQKYYLVDLETHKNFANK